MSASPPRPADRGAGAGAATGSDARRRRRRPVSGIVEVIDSMSERVIGQLGNVSETGMLLLASTPLVEDALYQVRFKLAGSQSSGGAAPTGGGQVEVGVHLLWQEDAGAAGKSWAGFRFINLPEPGRQRLRDWLASSP
ncbi:PilZ domain-containing protein [Lysobacter sp. H21R4]|uniref:PilZ domain-containing protein n=1 Tax=Lysobacter sp. H21R4 TaxID=2781021 RepID=UPI001887A8F1|nr:PilZ domain-containing protein [Lysobacter sp. H21R4]QOY63263.1 PilZ domain-containing protein [Lysobacter sp. H21R4]